MDTYSSTPYQSELPKNDDISADFLFVGGLPNGVSQTEIKYYFSPFGAVRNVVLPKNRKGKLKGFAYVYFENNQEAVSRILGAGTHTICDKQVVVQKGISPTVAAAITRDMQFRKIFVTNLPRESSIEEVEKIFATYGQVSKVLIPKDGIFGRGFCYLVFQDIETYRYVVSLKKILYKGRWLNVDPAVSVNLLHTSEFSHLDKKLNPNLQLQQSQFINPSQIAVPASKEPFRSTKETFDSDSRLYKYKPEWMHSHSHLDESATNYRFNIRGL